MTRLWLACLLCSLIVLSGCSRHLGDFTLLTTKKVDLSDFSFPTYATTNNQKVKGEDVSHVIIILPTKTPDLKHAIDNALDKNNAYMLSEASIRYDYFFIPHLYERKTFIVEGQPVSRTN